MGDEFDHILEDDPIDLVGDGLEGEEAAAVTAPPAEDMPRWASLALTLSLLLFFFRKQILERLGGGAGPTSTTGGSQATAPASHLMSIQMLGWLETRSLAARLGLQSSSVDVLIDQIPNPTLGRGAPGPVNATVEMMESQLRDAVESARKIQAPVPVGALAAQIYGMVGTGGYINLDYSVVDQAVYALRNADATEQQGPGEVALSVDTIQQSLDVRHRCHAAFLRISSCARAICARYCARADRERCVSVGAV